jgi:hypothetical protein
VYASDAKFDFDPKVSNHQAPKTLVNTMDEFVEEKKRRTLEVTFHNENAARIPTVSSSKNASSPLPEKIQGHAMIE